ncbi:anthranilate synthase component II [Enterobacteriaceae endosymbiont of Donacia tomentosa]|uniref:glutamine amidotransferase-related protein n=1 Tax=Enterobacteriaceae endosymbiont of Donacia tomentosa TaxID=2675787 RepID=UPI0014491BA4|nr:gamma-glutamyl-gamma-aminobutyrate hydrolase family protein [Enterobacteriaceae endosymbiont of Donacia tomentosa]QJC31552.1 anthranilate synthase component II [Enterobacteriaceae endosymbiont of Donacia tomentosa]
MSDIFILDNFDSFIYNLVDQLRFLGHKVMIYRNNLSINFLLNELIKMKDPLLLLSPGPGYPKNAGFMLDLLRVLIGKIPIIGICLGYQAIVKIYGGHIVKVGKILHGKSSPIIHDNKYMFARINNPMYVARYHSLMVNNIPNIFTINAKFKNMVMGFRYNKYKICGFQFHPESILTPNGNILLEQTIKWACS